VNATTATPATPVVALVGNPNCGKTALFNLLTGSRQKIANYAGVTVERKEGTLVTPNGRRVRVMDLPGAYSLNPRTPDERITCDLVLGRLSSEGRPDVIVSVVDATNLRRHLRMVLPLKRLGHRVVVALNMVDLAKRRGLPIDAQALSRELGLPVVETVGIKAGGAKALVEFLDALPLRGEVPTPRGTGQGDAEEPSVTAATEAAASDSRTHAQVPPSAVPEAAATNVDHGEVERILQTLGLDVATPETVSDRIDRVVLHPVLGPVILAITLFMVFQAVFSWATPVMDGIEWAMGALAGGVASVLPDGPLQSLIVDGIIAGAGGVLVFLPQIVILFFFILVLEDSGYLPRAAFLLDRLMGSVGLSGRSFIPLLSSFACAIPGIMATRTIPNARDRLITIMIAPLMTCSARLPVYALLIAAFVPATQVWGGLQLQGVVLFALYVAGVASAFLVAWVLKRFRLRGAIHPLQMELPTYHWPSFRNLRIGLFQRVEVFLKRVGGIILALMVLLWFLSSFPAPPPGFTGAPIEYSLAGRLGKLLAVVFEPIGLNWQISIALVPGLAAREVAVGALGTVYALSAAGDDVGGDLAPIIAATWGLPTAFALLAWYVFAPQCLATLAVVKRETNSWRYPLIMAGYLFGLAYLAAGATYYVSRWALGS
jgi:ferrous iron transport protein B